MRRPSAGALKPADAVRGRRKRAARDHWTGPRENSMKPQEARDMTQDELLTRERELADELFHLRLRRATSQLPNPMKVRETRHDLARIKTALRERVGLAAAKALAKATKTAEAGPEGPSRPTGSG